MSFKADGNAIRALVLQALRGLGADETAAEPLAAWVELVARWNERIDLTAARSPEELVDLLLADALIARRWVQPQSRWIDVGTGAGAPGLGLSILCPEASFTLVEPLIKRVAFLRTVLGTLALTSVQVLRGRGESVRASFDGALSRATLPPADWLILGHRLAPGGDVLVLLARDEPPSIPGRLLAEEVAYTWPLTGAARRIARYRSEPGEPDATAAGLLPGSSDERFMTTTSRIHLRWMNRS